MIHTSGQYRAERGRIYATNPEGHEEQIAFYGKSASVRPKSEHEPTGQLLAAAPDLLKALKGLLGIADDSRGVDGYHLNGAIALWGEFKEVQIAEDAIAKARL